MPYERSNIQKLAAYTPGEQPDTTSVIKLNTNENPYPPCDAVMKAIASVAAEQLRKYPPPLAMGFRKIAAKVHGISPSQVLATNGGDELLRLAITVFCEPAGGKGSGQGRGGLGVAEPSYSLYPVLASIQDTPVTRVPLREDFSLPADFASRLNAAGCTLAMIVNPHAPSGRLEPLETLLAIAREFKGVLLIDEAYVDFAPHDALPLVREQGLNNVLLLRSFSKGYSLAGLRFGYGMGHADLIAALDKARDSYNTDILSQAAATASLEHRDEARKTWQAVIQQRNWLRQELTARGFAVLPSDTNFVLATPPAGAPAAASLYQSLKARGIFVRYFDQDRLRDKLRITLGTPDQNKALIAALDALLSPAPASR